MSFSPEAIPPSPESIRSAPSPPTTPPQQTEYVRPILERSQPASLHLTPCTLQQFLDLDFDENDRYELANGLLVSAPQLAPPDPEHQSIVHWLCHLLFLLPSEQRRKVHAYAERALLLSSKNKANKHREETSSKAPAAASSSRDPRRPARGAASSSTEGDTCRIPDFYVVSTDEGSEASDAPSSPFEPKLSRTPGWKRAIMVGELTSINRMQDLRTRLAEYEREQIPEYIILNGYKQLKPRSPCVEVHKLQKTGREKGKYTKQVYSGDDKVDCSFFKHWKLTANQMLDYKYLRDLVENEKRKQEEAYERAEKEWEKAEKERERAEKEWEKAEKERERADRERADRVEEDLKKYKAHVRAFLKGERSTPPRGLELDETQLKIKSKTRSECGEASKSPASPASPTSPKSPTSPPYMVRRVDASDVKTSSHKDGKDHRHGKK